MRHMILAVLALVSFPACANWQGTPPRIELIGQWRVEFHGRSTQERASGRLNLSTYSANAAACRLDTTCTSDVTGTHEIDFDSLLHRQLLAEVIAGLDERGRVLLLPGGCCDRGEISAIGSVRQDTVRGTWVEMFLEEGRRGRFVMTRVPDPS